VFQLSNTLKENNIQLVDAEGNAFAQPSVEDLNGPVNILLVGSDTRKGQGKGYGDDTSELADVIMLLHISLTCVLQPVKSDIKRCLRILLTQLPPISKIMMKVRSFKKSFLMIGAKIKPGVGSKIEQLLVTT
jgi:hypothetical protein